MDSKLWWRHNAATYRAIIIIGRRPSAIHAPKAVTTLVVECEDAARTVRGTFLLARGGTDLRGVQLRHAGHHIGHSIYSRHHIPPRGTQCNRKEKGELQQDQDHGPPVRQWSWRR